MATKFTNLGNINFFMEFKNLLQFLLDQTHFLLN